MEKMEKLLLTYRDVGEITGYCRTTISEMVRTGQLETVRNGRSVRIPRSSLDDWIKRQLENNVNN